MEIRWQGLRELAWISGKLGHSAAAAWTARAETVRSCAQQAFWNDKGGYYLDTLEFPLLSCDGNLAAVAWGFCDEVSSERIFEAMRRLKLWTPWGPRAGQRYPSSEKGCLARLALMHG